MSGRRADGTNPRAQGTNPRATAGEGAAASPGGEGQKAGLEVSTQIPDTSLLDGVIVGQRHGGPLVELESFSPEAGFTYSSSREADPRWTVGEEKKGPPLSEEEIDLRAAEHRFMTAAQVAKTAAPHDDECAFRRGKECGCRDNLTALADGRLKELERQTQAWNTTGTVDGKFSIIRLTADLVRVDEGRQVAKSVPDPVSPTAKPITIMNHEPPRWICLSCAASMRGTDIDHRCDEAVKRRAQAPIGLERSLAPEVKYGGGYRLTIWRDKAGEYHLGEEVVMGGRVVDERHIAGPEAWHVIEGAMLDAAVSKLSA